MHPNSVPYSPLKATHETNAITNKYFEKTKKAGFPCNGLNAGSYFNISRLNETKRLGLNRSPGQVRCMKQGTQSRSTGKTLRHGMGRAVGGGFRMGNTWTLMADSCQYMAKTTTIL